MFTSLANIPFLQNFLKTSKRGAGTPSNQVGAIQSHPHFCSAWLRQTRKRRVTSNTILSLSRSRKGRETFLPKKLHRVV